MRRNDSSTVEAKAALLGSAAGTGVIPVVVISYLSYFLGSSVIVDHGKLISRRHDVELDTFFQISIALQH